MSLVPTSTELTIRPSPFQVEEVDDDNCQIDLRSRAKVACQMLMALPDVASYLQKETKEAKEMCQFLYQATDDAIQNIHKRISDGVMTHQGALQELYVRTGNEFAAQKQKMECSEENQRLLYQWVAAAQKECEGNAVTATLAVEKVLELHRAYEKICETMSSMKEASKALELKGVENNTAVQLRLQESAVNFQQAVAAYNALETAYGQVTSQVSKDMGELTAKMKRSALDTQRKLQDTQQQITDIKTQMGAMEAQLALGGNTKYIESAMEAMRSDIANLTNNGNALQVRVCREESIARGLSSAVESVTELNGRVAALTDDVVFLKAELQKAAGFMRGANASLASLGARFEALEQQNREYREEIAFLKKKMTDMECPSAAGLLSPAARAPFGMAGPTTPRAELFRSDGELHDMRAQMEKLRSDVKLLSEARSPSVGSEEPSAKAIGIKNAKAIASARSYINTAEKEVIPIFAVSTKEIGDLPHTYSFPYQMLRDMSPLVIAVAEKCQNTLAVNRAAVETMVSRITGNTHVAVTKEYLEMIDSGDNQLVAELLVALERGGTAKDRREISAWLSRARRSTAFQPSDKIWRLEATGEAAIALNPASIHRVPNVPPLNF